MKQINSLLLFLLVLSSCNCQTKSNSNLAKHSGRTIINIEELAVKQLGFADRYDTLPKLDFLEITEDSFITSGYVNRPSANDTFGETDLYFQLETKNGKIRLTKEKLPHKKGVDWYDYLGFYPVLNMYAVTLNSEDEHVVFSDFELIDKNNSAVYKIMSPGDGSIENPEVSADGKYLVYSYNQIYDDNNSFIGVLKENEKKEFEEFRSFASNKFKVFAISWLANDVIAIKTSNDDGATFKYYKCSLFAQPSNKWKGLYHFEATNKDNAKTIFSISIGALNDVIVEIDDDGSKQLYAHVKATEVNENKIKIAYVPSLDNEMGVIYIDKRDKEYFISGNSIFLINPGNDEMSLERLK